VSDLEVAASSIALFALYAGSTGLAAAIFNQAIQWFRDRASRKRAATDFALKSAALLERFAHACLDRASDIDAELQQGHDMTNARLEFPVLEPYPIDQDGWLGISTIDAALLINLTLEIENKERRCSAVAWHESPHDGAITYGRTNTIIAADAWFAAKRLRENYGLPSHGKIDSREPEDHTTYWLEHKLNEIHALEAKIEASNRVEMLMPKEKNS
jgi:hypothetical protein